MKAIIKYLRIAPINGRRVAFCQLFDENGNKLFPDRVPDAPLAQVLEFIAEPDIDEEYVIENAFDILDALVRVHGFSA